MAPAFVGLLVSVSWTGLVLFSKRRSRFRGRLAASTVSVDRDAAVRVAAAHVRALTGMDVTGWPVFAVPSSEPALLQQAHQLDVMEQVAPRLVRWGLLYGWRVRFCGQQDTVVVGLGGTGRVNFLQMAGRRVSAATGLGQPTPPIDVPASIMPEPAPRMVPPTPTAATGSPSNPGMAAFVDEGPGVRVTVTLESWSDRIVAVATQATITADGVEALGQADRRWRRLQRAAMAGMVLALLAGGLALVAGRHAAPLAWPAMLGLAAFMSVMVGEPRMFPRMVVYELGASEAVVDCRRRHLRQTMVAAAVNGAFVAAGVAVGQGLLSAAGAPPFPSLAMQVSIGVMVASGWLGLTATTSSLLVARGRLAATAELPPEALRRLGYSWRDVIGASVQSALGEEVLYRLVIVSVAWHLTGQPLAGVAVAAALWAATHDVGDVRPRWLRSLELFVLGSVLGLVLVFVGLAAAVAAHFWFNLLLLGWPLLAPRSDPVEVALA